jgi:hypothetical protein
LTRSAAETTSVMVVLPLLIVGRGVVPAG